MERIKNLNGNFHGTRVFHLHGHPKRPCLQNEFRNFGLPFKAFRFSRKVSVWEDQNRFSIYITTEISGFLVTGKPSSPWESLFGSPQPSVSFIIQGDGTALINRRIFHRSLTQTTLSQATQASAKGTHHGIISNKLSSLFCSRPQNHLSASKEWLWNELMNNKRIILRRGFPRGICEFQHAWGMKEIWKRNILK